MKKLLLTSVFKPFGVDDEYNRKENLMELFYHQVTREQGIFSPRNHQPVSFGLYAIAENVSVPTVVLDFPSQQRFRKEITDNFYDYIGISFIAPNFLKAKRMAEIVREHAPRSKIILGGHGTRIPEIEKQIDCDYAVRGDGVKWFREFFGEDPHAPFKHPLLESGRKTSVMGVASKNKSGLLIPGIGCPLGCRFCCTSDFFERKYTPFLKSGSDLFDVACMHEKELGAKNFLIMDENFIRNRKRALDFVDLLEANEKNYNFSLFSSANAIEDFGIENLIRMGAGAVWIGVESKREMFEKNAQIDFPELVGELQGNGISVLTSMILFLEEHTKENIWEDIDFAISLRPDYIQFMQLSPLPQTELYLEYKEQGRLLEDIPYEEWHGQHRIWFKHPEFSLEDSERIIREAFEKDFLELGPSILRVFRTKLNGYKNLKNSSNARFRLRADYLAQVCQRSYPMLWALSRMAPWENARGLAREMMAEYESEFGKPTVKQNAMGSYVRAAAGYAGWKQRLFGDVRQPRTMVTAYNH